MPNALMMGVDYELFWSLDPKSLSPFVKAFSMKQELKDAEMWRQGLYFRMAVASTLDKKAKYPEKPMFFESQNSKPISEKDRSKIIKQKFMAHMALINARKRKEN